MADARSSSAAIMRAVLSASSSTAASNAAAFFAAGARKPLILGTYCSAAARMSASVTASVYGGGRGLMGGHMPTSVRGRSDEGGGGVETLGWQSGDRTGGVSTKVSVRG